MFVTNLPEPRRRRVVRHTLEHQRNRSVCERSVDDVTVPGNPANVGRAPVNVAGVIVENLLVRHRRVDEIAAAGVQNAFRFAGRARGIEDEERIFGPHFLAGTVGIDLFLDLVQPDVAVVDPAHVRAGVANDQHFLERRHVRIRRCFVDIGLQRHAFAATTTFVRRDHDIRLAVLDSARECVRREAAEYDRVDRADARAGEHRDRRLGYHRHVDRNPIAFFRAQRLERVCESTDAFVQFAVGDLEILTRIVTFPDDGDVIAFAIEVTIDAVVTNVQRAIVKPADMQIVFCKGYVLDLGERLDPVDALSLFGPEALVVLDGTRIH